MKAGFFGPVGPVGDSVIVTVSNARGIRLPQSTQGKMEFLKEGRLMYQVSISPESPKFFLPSSGASYDEVKINGQPFWSKNGTLSLEVPEGEHWIYNEVFNKENWEFDSLPRSEWTVREGIFPLESYVSNYSRIAESVQLVYDGWVTKVKTLGLANRNPEGVDPAEISENPERKTGE